MDKEKVKTLKEIRAILREAYKLTKQINVKESELYGPKILESFKFKFPNQLTKMAFEEFFEENFYESNLIIYTNDKGYRTLGYLKDNNIWYNPKKNNYIDNDGNIVKMFEGENELLDAFIRILSNKDGETDDENDLLNSLSSIILNMPNNLPIKE
jgi:hypothetical protein